MNDIWPPAVRWEKPSGVRIDVHYGAATSTKALIEAHGDRAGARVGNPIGDWGLFNVLRSRSVPCD
jgi:hypothetical protein